MMFCWIAESENSLSWRMWFAFKSGQLYCDLCVSLGSEMTKDLEMTENKPAETQNVIKSVVIIIVIACLVMYRQISYSSVQLCSP